MEKANKLILIALSIVILLIGTAKASFGWDRSQGQGKPDLLCDPQTLVAYDLCDDARDMVKESVVLYEGSSFALVKGAPGRVSMNNPQAVPIIDKNEVYVPAEFIAEALDAQASRSADAAAITIKKGHTSISFIAGQNKLSLNGTQVFLPYPTFVKYGEAYIHLPSICEVLGRNVCRYGNIILVNPVGNVADLNVDGHVANDLLYYFSGGKASSKNPRNIDSAAPVNASQLREVRNIRAFLNEDELNLYAFPVTEIDPDASAHDHSLFLQDDVVMAPVVLLRLMDIEVFESVKREAISLLEAAPFGNYTSLTLKPGTDHAYLNLQGEDPYKDEEAFKDRLVVLPAAPMVMNNHLYIPIVEISRLFGVMADWDQESCSVMIRSLGSPRFPNLRWAPQVIQKMKTNYELTMTICFKGTDGKESKRMDYKSSGYYDSGEYTGRAAVGISTEGSGSLDTAALYEVKRFLNKDFEYEYEVRDLGVRAVQTRTIASTRYCEILLTDIEYLRRKTELMTSHFYASDLLKKQSDVSMKGKPVDKYSIELNDMPSITELFGIRRLPRIFAGEASNSSEEDYVFENFRMELSLDKKGQIAKCSINYRGYKKNERQTASLDSEEYKHNTPFEVSINADFY